MSRPTTTQLLEAIRARSPGWSQLFAQNGRYLDSAERWVAERLIEAPADPIAAAETLTGTGALGALSLTNAVSNVTTTGAATATLADGSEGQLKTIHLATDGGDLVVTPANLRVGNTLTFGEAGDTITLQFVGGQWSVVANVGVVVA